MSLLTKTGPNKRGGFDVRLRCDCSSRRDMHLRCDCRCKLRVA